MNFNIYLLEPSFLTNSAGVSIIKEKAASEITTILTFCKCGLDYKIEDIYSYSFLKE